MTAMTQDEIVSAVRTVAQGLEALKSEHTGILHGLHEAPDPVANERAGLVQQSAEMIELGLGEAQVILLQFAILLKHFPSITILSFSINILSFSITILIVY